MATIKVTHKCLVPANCFGGDANKNATPRLVKCCTDLDSGQGTEQKYVHLQICETSAGTSSETTSRVSFAYEYRNTQDTDKG